MKRKELLASESGAPAKRPKQYPSPRLTRPLTYLEVKRNSFIAADKIHALSKTELYRIARIWMPDKVDSLHIKEIVKLLSAEQVVLVVDPPQVISLPYWYYDTAQSLIEDWSKVLLIEIPFDLFGTAATHYARNAIAQRLGSDPLLPSGKMDTLTLQSFIRCK